MSTCQLSRGNRNSLPVLSIVLLAAVFGLAAGRASAAEDVDAVLSQVGISKGICALLGLPDSKQPTVVIELGKQSDLTIYFQSPSAEDVAAVREAALAANLLGKKVFVHHGPLTSIKLADNLADAVIVPSASADAAIEKDILRVLRPEAKAVVGGTVITKPLPSGIDEWQHPYHTPDNNPQSTDQLAKAPYLTQFLAQPKFSPMPEVTVVSGGRVFKAMGHIAHKSNQNRWLNTLLGINAYNGTVLWERPLKKGFMIHRNTMIATPEYLYLGDDESCKRLDAQTGEMKDEIHIPADIIADGPVWKWMALQGGTLYALVGGKEAGIRTQPSANAGLGHWPWGMWDGHDYSDPRTSFGFGRTLLAIDPESKKVLWSHCDEDYLDSRGVCMNDKHIFVYCPEKFLACLDAKTGNLVWENTDADLLAAIGPNGRAQHYVTGYSTTTYIKCNDNYVFFAGPQRSKLVVASAKDGRLLWQKEHGNLQLVLRDDGFYAAGPAQTGHKLAYEDGTILASLPMRRACTRATGSVDSVFYRTPGGTVRIEAATNAAKHIAPMRPPCQDGVIISNGMLYWGPWMCGCQLSFYGHIGLSSAGSFDFAPVPDASRLESGSGEAVEAGGIHPGDWPSYCGDNARTMAAKIDVPRSVASKWTADISPGIIPSAPVTAGGLLFVGSRNGTVQALDTATGKTKWRAHTGGAVYFPPAIWQGRAFAGSADGYVYAFDSGTGKLIWRFRAAPVDRLITVYGKLISTWPVAGGVVVQDGTVYAAAGNAHYDGIHVFALDAVSGKVKWYNGSSGALSRADSGVSLQGNLYIRDGELRFIGGGVHEVARYDLKTGKCLNAPHDVPNSAFQTAFYAYYPAYGGYLSLDHTLDDGRSLVYDASYEGALHGNLALLPAGAPKQPKPESRWGYLRRRRQPQQYVWQDRTNQRLSGFAVTKTVLLAAGERPAGDKLQAFVAALNIKDGTDLWRRNLSAKPVKGGLAVSNKGQVFVSLESGEVVCFAAGR